MNHQDKRPVKFKPHVFATASDSHDCSALKLLSQVTDILANRSFMVDAHRAN
jgi:mannitol/fructose-specific phosphotransferase system IIA component (Ntr-type)